MRVEDKFVISGCITSIQTFKKYSTANICISHLEILFTIFANDGITRNALTEKINTVSSTTMKRYVRDLVSGYGLVVESSCKHDSRLKHLHLSSKGNEAISSIILVLQKHL